MKKHFENWIMAAMIAAVAGFVGCIGDGGIPGEDFGDAETALLTIRLDNAPMVSTRYEGSPSPAGSDNYITDFNVFVFDDKGVMIKKQYFAPDEILPGDRLDSGVTHMVSKTLEVTTAARQVYIIANAGDMTMRYSSKADIEEQSINISYMYTNEPAEYLHHFATGVSTGFIFENKNGVWQEDAVVNLRFIGARITVKVDNQMTGYDFAGTNPAPTVNIDEVTLLNVVTQSKMFSASLVPQVFPSGIKYWEGLNNNGFANYPPAEDYTLNAIFEEPYTPAAAGELDVAYFYVYENDAVTEEPGVFPTIVTLVGTDVEGAPVYFPVHLAPYETWASGEFPADGIKRGKSYDITIRLTGDATKGNGGGTNDPTIPVRSTNVKIMLSIADWIELPLERDI